MSNYENGLRVAHVMIQGIPQTTEKVGVLTQSVRDYVRERMTEEHFEELDPLGVVKAHKERRQALVLLGLLECEDQVDLAFALSRTTYDHEVDLMINSVRVPDQYRDVLKDIIDEAIIQNAIIQGLYEDTHEESQFAVARIQMFVEMLRKLGIKADDDYEYVAALMTE